MENQQTNTGHSGDGRSAFGRDGAAQMSEIEDLETAPVEMKRIETLRIPVGVNLADVERWMIFATLQKCGGNKTRAAALLGVSLKTLYNRLNAYRAQGLAMDYEDVVESQDSKRDASAERSDSPGRGRGLEGNLTETQ